MAVDVEVACSNEDCYTLYDYECEGEDAAEGSTHEAKCPACGWLTKFEIEWTPIATGERPIS